MKGKEMMKAFDNSVMRIVYTLGYLSVPGPKPLEYQLGRKDLTPLRVVALAIVGLMIATIIIASSLAALLVAPLLYHSQR